MANIEPIAKGRVASLAINGVPVERIFFDPEGPRGDTHAGFRRKLNGHDGAYLKTSDLERGCEVPNLRQWTGLSVEEIGDIRTELYGDHGVSCDLQPGAIFLENITLAGIPDFSKLPTGTRLVFPPTESRGHQAVLVIWEENGPCKTIAQRFAAQGHNESDTKKFMAAAIGRRGVMGFVFSPGPVTWGKPVYVFPPN